MEGMKKTIGIDLGGTSILAGVIDKRGNILKQARRDSSKAQGREEVLDHMADLINELLDEDIIGVGIGSPGFIDSDQGKVLKIGGNIKGWANTDVKREILLRIPKLPLFIENDANVAALCEGWIGAAKNFKNFLMLTLGTGVGGAIFTEETKILHGHRYQGAELGHMIMYPKGRACGCGQRGCVEQYISGSAVERRYKELSGQGKKGKDIFKDSKEDKWAGQTVDEFAEHLSISLVSLKNIFDPEAIIIGGGVINSKKYWWDLVLDYYKQHSNDPEGMEILPASYLNDAGMIGAGRLVFDKV